MWLRERLRSLRFVRSDQDLGLLVCNVVLGGEGGVALRLEQDLLHAVEALLDAELVLDRVDLVVVFELVKGSRLLPVDVGLLRHEELVDKANCSHT